MSSIIFYFNVILQELFFTAPIEDLQLIHIWFTSARVQSFLSLLDKFYETADAPSSNLFDILILLPTLDNQLKEEESGVDLLDGVKNARLRGRNKIDCRVYS